MSALIEWAERWQVSPKALEELCSTALHLNIGRGDDASEARVQSEIRLAAARNGHYLFRNNNGAGKMASGNFVRYGLGNDSPKLNEKFKSADLIGWSRVLIQPKHIGRYIAQFLSVEVKRRDWQFAGTLEEMAQVAWATLVNAQGGRAIITNTDASIDRSVSAE